MSNEMNGAPAPRKKHHKRPKWKRMLRRYWPLLRLIIVLALVIVLVVALCKKCSAKKQAAQEAELAAQQQEEKEAAEREKQREEQEAVIEASYTPKPDAISTAAVMAGGYDYHGAIDVLKQVKDYESDADIQALISAYMDADSKLFTYADMKNITHIFFHILIADTDRAFDGDSREKGYNLYMTTCQEFRDILQSMYDRGYVLVSPHQVAGEVKQADGSMKMQYLEIRLPAGKKPFMMSQDDVSYYGDNICGITGMDETPRFATVDGDGFASRIVIGDNGRPTCEYMDAQGNIHYGEYDLVPILDAFCLEHPDFSYHGARAIIATTGYEGAFGYRTKPSYEAALGSERYRQECEDCAHVAQVLREQGWDLASHTYGHPNFSTCDVEKVRTDTEKFHNTVESVIGDVDILIYPHGGDIAEMEKYDDSNEKFTILYADGFRYFFNVDNCVAWHQMGDHYFRGNRRDLDGYRMYHYPDSMNDLIDARAILDPARPLPVPNI